MVYHSCTASEQRELIHLFKSLISREPCVWEKVCCKNAIPTGPGKPKLSCQSDEPFYPIWLQPGIKIDYHLTKQL